MPKESKRIQKNRNIEKEAEQIENFTKNVAMIASRMELQRKIKVLGIEKWSTTRGVGRFQIDDAKQ